MLLKITTASDTGWNIIKPYTNCDRNCWMKLLSAFFLSLVPPNYFYKTGSTEVPFATRSQDSPLERAWKTGRIWKTSGSSRICTLLSRIDFTSLIRSNKFKINLNDDYVSRIAPWFSCPVTLQLLQNFKGFTEIPLNQSEGWNKTEWVSETTKVEQTNGLSFLLSQPSKTTHSGHSFL